MAVYDHSYDSVKIALSNYAKNLNPSLRNAYIDKLKHEENGNVLYFPDPYLISKENWLKDVTMWPKIEYPDLVNYLISSKGEYNSECLKNYKSLAAYDYVISGKYLKMSILYGNMSLRDRSALEEKNKQQQQQRRGLRLDEKSQDSSDSSSHATKRIVDGRGTKYTIQGILKENGRDLCDCLDVDCPGCFMPCPRCSSNKCGHECRQSRRWVYDSYEIEGTKKVVTNPFKK